MSDNDFRAEMDTGKPLFSLQVDDFVVQQIFQKLADRIKQQNNEIQELKDELANRPTLKEFSDMKNLVLSLQKQVEESNIRVGQTMNGFKQELDERSTTINQLVQGKINEMLFSVSAAIRGQVEMLEKSSSSSDGSRVFQDMKLSITKLNNRVDELKNTVFQIATAFGDSSLVTQQGSSSVIQSVIMKDRAIAAQNAKLIQELRENYIDIREKMEMILPDGLDIPQFKAIPSYNRAEIPEFHKPPKINTVFEFMQHVTSAIPSIQGILREYHSYLTYIDMQTQSKVDRRDYLNYINNCDLRSKKISDSLQFFEEKKESIVYRNDFDELANSLYDIVNGTSSSSCTNTKCIACGKPVQSITGSFKSLKDNTTQDRCCTSRPNDMLKLDGLVSDLAIEARRVKTARSAMQKHRVPLPK